MNESQFLGILTRLSVPEREFLFRGGAREVAEDGGAGRETIATSQESEAPAFLSNLFLQISLHGMERFHSIWRAQSPNEPSENTDN